MLTAQLRTGRAMYDVTVHQPGAMPKQLPAVRSRWRKADPETGVGLPRS
ncbi:hypothetical protein [Streptomyces sp. CB00455]|nr:hypothetical protein [Streptomyces sp. CB00455]